MISFHFKANKRKMLSLIPFLMMNFNEDSNFQNRDWKNASMHSNNTSQY